MGVPKLRKYLHTAIENGGICPNPPVCNTLFIDAKQLYYTALDKLKGEPGYIEEFIQLLKNVIQKLNPTDFVYIAMDGVAPVAKFQDLRERHFSEEFREDFTPPKIPFQFESDSELIESAIRQMCTDLCNDHLIVTKDIIYSGAFVAGESEHKYFDYVRKLKREGKFPQGNHFVYSFDNDLFILPFQFSEDSFYLQITNSDTVYDLTIIRNHFLNLVLTELGNPQIADRQRVLNDIMALTFLIGVDFLPNFPYFEGFTTLRLDFIIKNYARINKTATTYQYLIVDDVFNPVVLNQVVQSSIKQKAHKSRHFGYRMLNESAQAALRGLNFTYLYYTSGVPHWQFYLRIKEMPPLQLLAPLMKFESKDFFNNIPNNEPVEPFLKTLINHPIDQSCLIPWEVYQIRVSSPIAEKYWPHVKDKKDVPIFDLQEIKQVLDQIRSTIPQELIQYDRREPTDFILENK